MTRRATKDTTPGGIDVATGERVTPAKKPKSEDPKPTDVVMWGRRKFEWQTGAPANSRDFELVRLLRHVEELEAEKRNLLDNLSSVKGVLQEHEQMWMVGFREQHWPTYAEANSMRLSVESAIGRLERLTNGRNTFALLPEGHPWLKEK